MLLAPGAAVALDGCGLLRYQRWTPTAEWRAGHFLRAIVPIRGEVVEFKGRAQLWRPRAEGQLDNTLPHIVAPTKRLSDRLSGAPDEIVEMR